MSYEKNTLDRNNAPWVLDGIAAGQLPWMLTDHWLTAFIVIWVTVGLVIAYELGRKYA